MDDGSVLVVEIRRGALTRVEPDGSCAVIAQLGGGPNGAAIGPDGAVYICNNGGYRWVDTPLGIRPSGIPRDYVSGSIQRVDLTTGAVTILYESCDGRPLRGPNDIVFDSTGGFWFTDLGRSNSEMHQHGSLYYARPDGSSIVRVVEPLLSPNGVGLSPDQASLYVADTLSSRLFVFDLERPGCIRGHNVEAGGSALVTAPPFSRVLGPLPGYQMLDSLAVEASGGVSVGTLINGAITTFDPSGSIEQVPVDDAVTSNICFGGSDMRDAYVTGSRTGRLFKARWPRAGLRLAFNA